MNSDEFKSRMTPEERERRRSSVGKAAAEKIAKSEQLNFRIEATHIEELQRIAYSKSLPLGSMIRDWVIERMMTEKHGEHPKLGQMLHDLYKANASLSAIFGKSVEENYQMKDPVRHLVLRPLKQNFSSSGSKVEEQVNFWAAASNSYDQTSIEMSPSDLDIEQLKTCEHLLSEKLQSLRTQLRKLERLG